MNTREKTKNKIEKDNSNTDRCHAELQRSTKWKIFGFWIWQFVSIVRWHCRTFCSYVRCTHNTLFEWTKTDRMCKKGDLLWPPQVWAHTIIMQCVSWASVYNMYFNGNEQSVRCNKFVYYMCMRVTLNNAAQQYTAKREKKTFEKKR